MAAAALPPPLPPSVLPRVRCQWPLSVCELLPLADLDQTCVSLFLFRCVWYVMRLHLL